MKKQKPNPQTKPPKEKQQKQQQAKSSMSIMKQKGLLWKKKMTAEPWTNLGCNCLFLGQNASPSLSS